MKLSKLINEYMESPNFKQLSDGSQRLYIHFSRKLLLEFGDKDVVSLKRSDFIRYMLRESDSPASVNAFMRVASVIFSYGMDIDAMPFNPVSRLRKLKTGEHQKWTVEEVRSIINLGDRVVSTAVALAWYTGQREGDILSLKWSDYRDGYIVVRQQKTKIEMKIAVHPDLEAYLNGLKLETPNDHYIVSGRKKLSGNGFRYHFDLACKEAKIDKVFHGIRKGIACSLAENGRPLSEIAALLGHKSIRMAAYYTNQADSTLLIGSAVSNTSSVIDQEPC